MRIYQRKSPKDRFLAILVNASYVRMPGMDSDCIVWPAASVGPCCTNSLHQKVRYGAFDCYGLSNSCKKESRAHRAAWCIFRGPIPKGMNVLHRCDNPPCVNIDHLFLGTHKDNMQDCIRKGRWGSSGARNPARGAANGHSKLNPNARILVGEDSPNVKLTERQVRRIRRLYATGRWTKTQLARKFNVHITTISSIVSYETWKHVV